MTLAGTVYAAQVSVPSSPGLGYVLTGLVNGNYTPQATSSVRFFTLTTSGTSGAATYSAGTLNIPQYSGGGGSGTVSTSSSETSTQIPFWTTNSATPALLSGGNANFTFNNAANRLSVTYASTTAITATTFFGTLVGNASTATALAANGTNCSAGNYPLGVDASGNSENCTLANTGSVTSIAAGLGLTGGTITTVGTLGLLSYIATGTVPTSGQLAYWGSAGTPSTLFSIATNTLVGGGPITVSNSPVIIGGSSAALGCTSASSGVTGCLTGTDWNTFNGKGSGTVTSIATTYPVTGGTFTTSGTIALAFGTTTSNIWANTQTFTNPIVDAALNGLIGGNNGTTYAVSTSSLNASITGSSGSVANAVTFNSSGSGGSSPQVFNGSGAETISYNTIGAQVAGTYDAVITASSPIVRAINNLIWTGLATTSQPASSNLLTSNGAAGVYGTATSTLTATGPLTGSFTQVGSGGALGCTTASNGVAGCLNSSDWATFNGKQAALALGAGFVTSNAGNVLTATASSSAFGTATLGQVWGYTGSGAGWVATSSSSGLTTDPNWAIDALSYLSPTTTNSYGVNTNASGITYGYAIGDKLLAYASSTNSDTIFGLQAGGSATTTVAASNLSAFGALALNSNTTGIENSAFGEATLQKNTTGSVNTALGWGSLTSDTIGSNNTAINDSLVLLTAGDHNIAVGYDSGFNVTSGYGNIFLGTDNGTTASRNNISTGFNDIMIGFNTAAPSSATSNFLDIGSFLYGTLPATTTGLQVPTSGTFGIGTSTPFAKLAISLNNTDTSFYNNAFLIASSTGTATSTLFSISNTGSTTIGLLGACSGTSALNTTAAGLITCGSGYLTSNQTITLTGAVTGSGATAITTAFGAISQGVLANINAASTIPTATATSSLFNWGTGLTSNTNSVSLAIPVTVANGGTGVTSLTADQFLYTSHAGTSVQTAASSSLQLPLSAFAVITQGWLGNSGAASIAPAVNATSTLFTGTAGQDAYFSGTGTLLGTSSLFINAFGNVGIGSTSPQSALAVGNGVASSSISVAEYDFGKAGNNATSTAATLSPRTSNNIFWPIGLSATTLTICNFQPGDHMIVTVRNPNGTAGALTWAACAGSELLWAAKTTPTQTTTANDWDIWSFTASSDVGSTSPSTIMISGAASTGF